MGFDKYKQVGFSNIAVSEEDIWFCNIYNSTLLKMNKESGDIYLEKVLPSLGVTEKIQYGAIIYHEGVLIIAPRNAQKILIYNVVDRTIKEIALKSFGQKEIAKSLFTNAILYQESVFLFPGKYPAIVKIDLDTYNLTYYTEWFAEVIKNLPNDKSVVTNEQPICIDDYCVFPIYRLDALVKFKFIDGTYEIYSLSNKMRVITSLQYDGSDFWLSYADTPLVLRVNFQNNERRVYDLLPKEAKMEMGYCFIYPYKNSIIAVPLKGNMLVIYDKITGRVRQYTNLIIPMEVEKDKSKLVVLGCNFCGRQTVDENILLYSAYEGNIFLIDLVNEAVTKYVGILKRPEDVSRIKIKCFEGEKVIQENREYSLLDFLFSVGEENIRG